MASEFYGFYQCAEIRKNAAGEYGIFYRRAAYTFPSWWWFSTVKAACREIDTLLED